MASNSSSLIRVGLNYLFVGFLMILSISELAQSISIKTVDDAKHYLLKYGYLPSGRRSTAGSRLVDANSWSNSIRKFQRFAGLNITGQLDFQTLRKMSQPRCGVSDASSFRKNSRAKRYVLQGSSWPKKDLTYRIENFPRTMHPNYVRREITRAFNVWSMVTDLTFTPKADGPIDIDILFMRGYHGDHEPFDGEGGILAHAFFPQFGGTTHFDDAEKWSSYEWQGTSLFRVAAHEFGHALGLEHSENQAAIMAPIYRGDGDYNLHSDDIMAIQALYGRWSRTVAPRKPDGYFPQPPRGAFPCINNGGGYTPTRRQPRVRWVRTGY